MNIRLTQGILGFGVLAFALWLFPGLAGAQQPENTVVCVEGVGAIPLNYGDNTSDCAIDPATDLDHFIFTGAAGTSIRFNVYALSTTLDPRLEVRDPTGVVLVDQFCDTFGSNCSFSVDLDPLLAGTYLVAVSDAGTNETGGYRLSLNCLVGSCPGAPALPEIAYDVAVEDALSPAVDMDLFTFQGAGGTSIRFNVHALSTTLDPRLEIRDPTGAVLVNQFCDTFGSNCSFSVDLDLSLAGTYLVAVSDAGTNETGGYRLSLNCVVGSCPGAPALPEIAYDVAVEDALLPAVDMDLFTFQGAGGTSIRFNVHALSTTLDPRLEIRDPTGALLVDQFCDTFGSNCSFSVDLDPSLTGMYQIAVSDQGTNETGGYQISLNCLYGSCPGAPALPEIDYDVAVEDSLMPAVDMDLFAFGGAADTSIRFNVHALSTTLDPRLEIRDPTGAVLVDQFCDTFGSNCSFSVDLDLPVTGAYLVAMSDSGVNETGNYSFSLNCVFGSCLIITPRTDYDPSGPLGGPFDTIKTYTLTNNGNVTVDFTASASENFVTLSQTSGTLTARASTTVTLSINANANNLPPGIHAAQVDFTNATNGQGDTVRQVELNVKCPGSLEVTPETDYQPAGPAGGPFAPDSKSYKLTNLLIDPGGGTLCGSDIEFSIETFGDYIDVSPTSGMLEAGGTTTVTVSLNDNANDLADGSYDGTVTITNTTFNIGDTERAVTLIVEPTVVDPTSLDWLTPILEYLMREPDKPQTPESP